MRTRPVECFRDAGAAENAEECVLDFGGRYCGVHGVVVCQGESAVLRRERELTEGVEDFFREGGDQRWGGEVVECFLMGEG